jgi:predicted branched-subunit amino acid permease
MGRLDVAFIVLFIVLLIHKASRCVQKSIKMFYSFCAVAVSKVCFNDTQSITALLIHKASQCFVCFVLLR